MLEEGEIHVKCSQRCLLRPDGQKSDRITGDVLVCFNLAILKVILIIVLLFPKVTRSPCKLPTDVQKVFIVYYNKNPVTQITLIFIRLKQYSNQSLMTTSMSLCSPSKVLEVLQVCWVLVRVTMHSTNGMLIYFQRGL